MSSYSRPIGGYRRALWLLVALAVGVLESGLSCAPALINFVTPTGGSVIATPSFLVQIQLGPAANPSTLSVDLNGVDITAQLTGGPPTYSKTFGPGAPLRDVNLLTVRVKSNDGVVGAVFPVPFQYGIPKAHASLVTDPSQCPTGPLAHCTTGDFLLANDSARFVIQKAAQREEHFSGTFGGNLIDAEVVKSGVPQGNDNFWEIQPAFNIESVIDAQTAEIVNDGQDGTPAIVRTCGPDDLLDDINPSSVVGQVGGTFPDGVDDQDYDIDGCTEYVLAASTRTLELTTTIENNEADDLALYPGDYMNGGGSTEQFTPLGSPAVLTQSGVGETLANFGIQALSLFGFSDGAGVDYALLVPQPPTVATPSSSFTQTGVSYVLHGQSIPLVLFFGDTSNAFPVPAGASNSFTRWFSVGDGSASNAVQSFLDATSQPSGTLKGCVRDSGGQPVPGARVVAARDSAGGTTSIKILRDHWVAGSDGCYQGRIGTGKYLVAAAKEGFPYEGGGSTPATHVVTVTSGGTTVQDVVLPQAGHLHVSVVDQNNQPIPARVGVVGFDPSPEPTLSSTLTSSLVVRTNLFYDLTRDAPPTGLTRTEYTDATGNVDMDVEPGTYQIAVSRGNEYSLFTKNDQAIPAGTTTTVNAQVVQVLDTTGFISSDYHVHMAGSPDSRISHRNRIAAYAGEGVDNLITTDHALLTDLMPEIASLGFAPWLFSTQGEEITTFDYGHFNAYPQGTDSSQVQTYGATDHGGAAPPGMDFPAYGHFNLSPAEIEAAAMSKPQNAGFETVVQINHISSHFDPLKINTSLTPPASQLAAGEPAFFRLDPSIPNFFHAFAALELWNGYTKDQAYCEFLGAECSSGSPDGRIGIWMNLLNQGIKTTFIADTDSHEYHNLRSGGARSWTPSSTDVVANIHPLEIPRAVRAGKVVGGQGIYVKARLTGDNTGGTASFEGVPPGGDPTQITVGDGMVHLQIDVQAPTWAPYDQIQIFENASTRVKKSNAGVPTLFTAVPTLILNKGTDFTVTTVPVSTTPPASRFETHVSLPFTLSRDTWFVVVVRGNQNVSPPMFPVHPDAVSLTQNPNLAALENVTASDNGIRALGATNALYVDVDGNGDFDPPGVSVVP